MNYLSYHPTNKNDGMHVKGRLVQGTSASLMEVENIKNILPINSSFTFSFLQPTHAAEIVVHKKCLPRMLSWMALTPWCLLRKFMWKISGMFRIPMFGFSPVAPSTSSVIGPEGDKDELPTISLSFIGSIHRRITSESEASHIRLNQENDSHWNRLIDAVAYHWRYDNEGMESVKRS